MNTAEQAVEAEQATQDRLETEAEYALERAVKCPACGAMVDDLHVVRLLRTKVNFTSNLPRRGVVVICPDCEAIVAANIGSRVL